MSDIKTIEQINEDIKQVDSNLISDGYHTFGELYEHRILLFIALCKMIKLTFGEQHIYKTEKDFEKNKIDGWFILTVNDLLGFKQISYHIPDQYWYQCDFTQRGYNYNYDGHNSQDVLERLMTGFQ